jgi:phage gpG-like protein
MLSANIDPAPAIAKLDVMKQRLRAGVRGGVKNGAGRLLSLVQAKLSGEVLQARSGALLRSIHVETNENADGFGARVFSDGSVPYARIQEYGGRVNIPALAPVNAKALAFAWGGRMVFAKSVAAHVVDLPERSYMRYSLAEFADTFTGDIRQTVADALS